MSNMVNESAETTDDDTTEDEDGEHDVPVKATEAADGSSDEKALAVLPRGDPPTKKLGVIGGRKKSVPEPHPDEASPSPKPFQKKKNALGVIGGKGKDVAIASSSDPKPSDENDLGTNETSNGTGATREDVALLSETDEQKAARRRNELKRSLEMKPKALPKKRRF